MLHAVLQALLSIVDTLHQLVGAIVTLAICGFAMVAGRREERAAGAMICIASFATPLVQNLMAGPLMRPTLVLIDLGLLLFLGMLALRSAFPITLGANIGTTITALIASLAVARPEGLSIALVHLLFNLLGVLLLYPFPPVREVPMRLAMGLADVATRQHRVVFLWLVIGFLILPLMGLFLFQ